MTTAQFPTLTVELGLGSAPANTWIVFQPSNVTSTSAGFDTFTFGAGVAFTDVTADVRDLQTHRGRQRSADRFAAGACAFTLDDTGNTTITGGLLSSDSFNRANGALGSTDGSGTKDPATWTTQAGTFAIASNQASCTSVGGSHGVATVDLGTGDIDVSVTVVTNGNIGDGLVFRFSNLTGPAQYWLLNMSSGLWRLQKVDTFTTTVATGPAYANGDTIRVVAVGSSITAYVNGVAFGSTTDTFNQTATEHGLYTGSTSTIWDSWSATAMYTSYFGAPNLVPNVRVNVRANWQGVDYYLFAGYIDSITPNWTPGQYSYSTITITATDAFKPLQAYKPPTALGSPAGSGEDTGARVNRILDGVATFTTSRDIDTGNSTLQGTTLSQSALDDIYAAVESEGGQFFINGNGSIRFENRQYRLTNPTSYTSQVTLADSYTDSQILIETAPVTFDATLVENRVTGQNTNGGNAQTVSDATSITANFTVDYSNTSLILQTDAAALHWANWRLWLYKNARKRVDSATIRPVGDPSNLWPEVLSRDLSDRVTVKLRPPHGSAYSADYFVEGIDHVITTTPQDWVTTYHLSDASQTTNMLLFDIAGHDVFDTNTFAEF